MSKKRKWEIRIQIIINEENDNIVIFEIHFFFRSRVYFFFNFVVAFRPLMEDRSISTFEWNDGGVTKVHFLNFHIITTLDRFKEIDKEQNIWPRGEIRCEKVVL